MRAIFDDDHEAFRDSFRSWIAKEVTPHYLEWEAAGITPREMYTSAGQYGFLGMQIPEEYGGGGTDDFRFNQVIAEEFAAAGIGGSGLGMTLHNDVTAPYFLELCNDEQKQRWLPGIASGELITAIAMTEPGTGTDLAGMVTTAIRDGDEYVLNGSKTFITNGINADLVIVAAKTDPDNKYGITMFLVPAGTEGFSVANKLDKHGWRCSDTAELVLDDVWVPDSAVLGTVHRGFYETMKNFQNERMVLVGMGIGAAQAAIDLTWDYTTNRPAFGGHLADLGAIRQRMAMNQAKVDAVRAGMYHAAWLGDQGVDNVREMSGVKAWGCEVVNEVMFDCLQFHGGLGYMRESTIERMTRDARILPIGGGATEVMLEEVAKRLQR